MKNVLYTLGFLALCTSCKTIKISDFQAGKELGILLPALEPRIQIEKESGVYEYWGSVKWPGPLIASSDPEVLIAASNEDITITRDVRFHDVVTLFEREVRDKITQSVGKRKGYINLKIPTIVVAEDYGWMTLSILTLGLPAFVGMPVNAIETAMDIEVEIYDLDENLVGRYNATCERKVPVAFYHGYNKSDARRKSNLEAFRCAINDIKNQIVFNRPAILEKLNN